MSREDPTGAGSWGCRLDCVTLVICVWHEVLTQQFCHRVNLRREEADVAIETTEGILGDPDRQLRADLPEYGSLYS